MSAMMWRQTLAVGFGWVHPGPSQSRRCSPTENQALSGTRNGRIAIGNRITAQNAPLLKSRNYQIMSEIGDFCIPDRLT
jgi:hypothetical protein